MTTENKPTAGQGQPQQGDRNTGNTPQGTPSTGTPEKNEAGKPATENEEETRIGTAHIQGEAKRSDNSTGKP